MLKKLFSHTAIYGLAPQVTRFASIFALPIITPYLTPLDFGVYGIITAVTGAISVLGTIGLKVILTNTFFKSTHQYKWGWRQIYGFLMVWSIPFSVLTACILWFFVPHEAIDNRLEIILINVIPIIMFGPTSFIGTTLFQLKQIPIQIAVRSIIFGLMTIFLNIHFIAELKLGYMGWFYSTGIATVLNQASYFIPLNFKYGLRPIFNFKWRYIRKSLAISLPTVPHYYSAYLLDTSDRLIMKTLNISTADIGLYNASNTGANLFRQLGTAAGYAIGPMMNASYKEGDDVKARNLVFLLQISYFVLTFTVTIWLKEIFHFLLKNKELQTTYPLGIVLIMAYNYRPMYFGSNNKIFYTEKTKNLLKVTFAAGVLNVVANFILLPVYGYQAAAYTTFFSLMYMGYAGYFLKVFKQINHINYYPLVWIFATIGLMISSSYIVEFSPLIKIAITFFVVIIGAILIGRFSIEQKNNR